MKSIHCVKSQRGAITLFIGAGLMIASSLLTLTSVKSSLMQERMSQNIVRSEQAFATAEAGLEHGIIYFYQNRKAIFDYLANNSTSQTQQISLANGSLYHISYSQPDANDPFLIKVTVAGTSSDGSSQKTISNLIKYDAVLARMPSNPLSVKEEVNMGGNSVILNSHSPISIWSGGKVKITGTAYTENNAGIQSQRNQNNIDVIENDPALANATTDEFFYNFFGTDKNSIMQIANTVLTTQDISSLDGKTNEIIWIEKPGETVHISSVTIGSPTEPVILVINANARINGQATIYGYVHVTGYLDKMNGGANIYGTLSVEDRFIPNGGVNIEYRPTILSKVQKGFGSIGSIAGSWSDIW